MPFWILSGLLILASLLIVLAPLLRGRASASRRASYDIRVYRDQLREVDVERARGLLSKSEADATRIEVSRRLLHAADAEMLEAETRTAPRRTSLLAGLLTGLAVMAAALLLYNTTGAPGLPDLPRAERAQRMAEARANRPGQAEAEAAMAREPGAQPQMTYEDAALIDQLRTVLEERPDDVRGRHLLARSLASMGLFADARAAQEDVLALLGQTATADDRFELAELMILAAGGYVSPEAEAALASGLQQAPEHPLGRYYSGVALLQAGRPDLAYPLWARLLEEGPPDAPWIAPIEARIGEVARQAGQPAPSRTGPDAADVEAAEDMTPEDRQAMIEGMVENLGARLAEQGGPPADWAQFIRALGVLGQTERANAVLQEARSKFAGDPDALSRLDAAARAGGLTQ